MTLEYGNAPEDCGIFTPDWDEYMHYMYLPVVMPMMPKLRLPPNLEFMRDIVTFAANKEGVNMENPTSYIYVTARRGYASPGNPLNRPGWHTDGFGSDDVNYIWSDQFPTRFAVQHFGTISPDHEQSIREFSCRVQEEYIRTYRPRTLLRLTPSMVHAAPEIPAPGGERGFFKISFSSSRFNLKGNSHNYDFAYSWDMVARGQQRNDPVGR